MLAMRIARCRRHWPAVAVLLSALLSGCSGWSVAPTDLPAPPSDPQQLIVIALRDSPEALMLRAGSSPRGYDLAPRYGNGAASESLLAQLQRDYRLEPLAGWPIRPLQLNCIVLSIGPGRDRAALLATLQDDPRIELAQPLQLFDTSSTGESPGPAAYNDPYLDLQTAFFDIGAPSAQRSGRGHGVRIAVIDTGIDREHPDLAGRVIRSRDFMAAGPAFDHERHGTGVAGVMAALANNAQGIVGIAPDVELVALRACAPVGDDSEAARCNSYSLAQALIAAVDSGAAIINLSLGGPPDPLLALLLDYVLDRGITVIASVPPDGRRDGFPLADERVIAVDVSGQAATAGTLAAPGRDVLTLAPGGEYGYLSGSSMSAAQVSAAAALLLSVEPGLDAAQLRERLAAHRRADGSVDVGASVAALGEAP